MDGIGSVVVVVVVVAIFAYDTKTCGGLLVDGLHKGNYLL